MYAEYLRSRGFTVATPADTVTTDDGAPIGAVLTDRSGLYIGVNRTATELIGFSHTEMIAKSIWDLLPAGRS